MATKFDDFHRSALRPNWPNAPFVPEYRCKPGCLLLALSRHPTKWSNVRCQGQSGHGHCNGGTKTVTTTPSTKVVALVPGDRSELKPNAKVFIPGATRDSDGAFKADRITVGKDGVAPPM
jgi:hypothetical protein